MSSFTSKLVMSRLVEGQASGEINVNAALNRLDACAQIWVKSRFTTAQPGSPTEGDNYLLPASGSTGTEWAGNDGKLAFYAQSQWTFLTVRKGMLLYVEDERCELVNDGTGIFYSPSRGEEDFYHALSSASYDRFYPCGQLKTGTSLVSVGALTANLIYAVPFICGRSAVIDQLAIYVSVSATAGKRVRIGIYNNADYNAIVPGSLLYDSGHITVDTTGFKSVTGLTTKLTPKSLYWFVIHPEASCEVRGALATDCWPILGWDNALAAAPGVGWTGAPGSYGALPSSFPGSPTVFTGISSEVPLVFARFLS